MRAIQRCLPAVIVLLAASVSGAGTEDACSLLSPAEVTAAFGAKVPLKGGSMGTVKVCSGNTATATILIRLAKSKGKASADAAAAGIQMMKDLGAQVEVKTFGPITCSTITPPKNMEQYGFNTTCSVVKGGFVGAIEVTAKAKKDQVPIEKLRPLAEKMSARMP